MRTAKPFLSAAFCTYHFYLPIHLFIICGRLHKKRAAGGSNTCCLKRIRSEDRHRLETWFKSLDLAAITRWQCHCVYIALRFFWAKPDATYFLRVWLLPWAVRFLESVIAQNEFRANHANNYATGALLSRWPGGLRRTMARSGPQKYVGGQLEIRPRTPMTYFLRIPSTRSHSASGFPYANNDNFSDDSNSEHFLFICGINSHAGLFALRGLCCRRSRQRTTLINSSSIWSCSPLITPFVLFAADSPPPAEFLLHHIKCQYSLRITYPCK